MPSEGDVVAAELHVFGSYESLALYSLSLVSLPVSLSRSRALSLSVSFCRSLSTQRGNK